MRHQRRRVRHRFDGDVARREARVHQHTLQIFGIGRHLARAVDGSKTDRLLQDAQRLIVQSRVDFHRTRRRAGCAAHGSEAEQRGHRVFDL